MTIKYVPTICQYCQTELALAEADTVLFCDLTCLAMYQQEEAKHGR